MDLPFRVRVKPIYPAVQSNRQFYMPCVLSSLQFERPPLQGAKPQRTKSEANTLEYLIIDALLRMLFTFQMLDGRHPQRMTWQHFGVENKL
jgi:hypothetical protein